MRSRNSTLLVALAVSLSSLVVLNDAAAAGSPKELVEKLTKALRDKDMAAASALIEWGQAPVAAYRIFKMSMADCFAPTLCKVELLPFNDATENPQPDYRFAIPPEGETKLTIPGESGGFSMPFAKVGSEYKFVLGQPTEEAYLLSKANANARKIAELVEPDLVANGKELPANGGAQAASYQNYVNAISKGDTEYLSKKGSTGDRYYFGGAYQSNPVKAGIALELAQMENISTPTILGGFFNEHKAVLLVSGKNAQGWHTEGAVTIMNENGEWTVEEKQYESYSPTPG